MAIGKALFVRVHAFLASLLALRRRLRSPIFVALEAKDLESAAELMKSPRHLLSEHYPEVR